MTLEPIRILAATAGSSPDGVPARYLIYREPGKGYVAARELYRDRDWRRTHTLAARSRRKVTERLALLKRADRGAVA
jgi:hypothetical protein